VKLWQQPAQPLPVRLRPVRGETLVSYTFRLAAANELDRPTILLRALGEPRGALTYRLLEQDYDLRLNPHAVHRLEIFTGIPAERLRRALPCTTTTSALPADIPATHPYRCPSLRNHCDTCIARTPGRPKIRVHSLAFPHICRHHHRWIATDHQQPHQVSFAGTPEIITAHRRYARLLATTGDNDWTHRQLHQATSIAMGWATQSHLHSPKLHTTWIARAAALATSHGPRQPSPLLVFPEAVALAEILCDLHWRRHVAMAKHDIDLKPFYHRVAARLDQPPLFAALTQYSNSDALRGWVQLHRHHHQAVRTQHWAEALRHHPHQPPLPEIRHFK
jgi:TniQ